MYNLGDDKELDGLSREAAGKYIPPGKPDWQSMNETLDKIMPVEEKKRRIVFFRWLLPLLLAGGVTGYWLLHNNSEENLSAVKQTAGTLSPIKKETLRQTPSVSSLKTTGKNNFANSSTATPVEIQNINPDNAAKVPKTSPANPGVSGKGQESAGPLLLRSPLRKIQALAEQNTTVNSKQTPAQIPAPTKTTEPLIEKPQAPVQCMTITKEEKTVAKNDPPGTLTENVVTKDAVGIPEEDTVIEKSNAAQKHIRYNHGFSFALLAGVDKSTVKFKYGNEAGYNLGILAGYHFNNRWSLHTGAILTQKNYKMAGEDFTAPKGSIISYYKLETVEGYCRMWEVPVVARYTVNPSAKNSVFLSTGLSSYFMTKENYDYFYYYNGLPVNRVSSYYSTDTHILSILDFSVGFSKPVGKSWSMQLEPYAKLPLGGVGLGNIRLSSFGINLSVQYRQPARK